ncbi:2-oxoglutarate dehydrogenase complex dihydrolipoyllysine-residue succinyltransferase, partial [bacterium]|nr:2-oxoglutarate dehydrogenase complex dihydrolipoyllysine-residue succinyltransferase [bacterium]
ALGESVVEATVSRWLKKEGSRVEPGEALVELETDKVNLEVGAERAGVLSKVERGEGEDVKVGETLGILEDLPAGAETTAPPPRELKTPPAQTAASQPAPQPAVKPQPASQSKSVQPPKATPSARRLAQEVGVKLEDVSATGSGNQITREDIQAHMQRQKAPTQPEAPPAPLKIVTSGDRSEERIKMSRRRRTIAKRLVEAQHEAAMLTTYNEIDMTAVMDLRKRHKESFQKKHGVGLGIVSFFVKASIAALKEFPQINAEIQGDDIILKKYYDIGMALGAEEGLVVPVIRDADRLSFSEIEQTIKNFIEKSSNGTLSLEDLKGGTFTITNGGVFGSLMSTPILNPPQVGILGLHKIEERPVAQNGQVVIRQMMYVALSYDHRVVDGRESVQFLARIKQLVEDPASLLLE